MRARPSPVDLEPLRLDGDRRGVLLVHGFTGTPFEMRLLGEHLHSRGFSVSVPRLAGHAAPVAALAQTGWPEWLASAELALDELRARTDRVAVVGLSMGGLLTIELARKRGSEIRAVGLLATALGLTPWLARLIRAAGRSRFMAGRAFPKWGGSDIRDREMAARNQSTNGFPVAALNSLLDLGELAARHLGDVRQPAFVAHARHDHTIPFAFHGRLLAALPSPPVDELVLDRSYHVLTLDVERELVFRRLTDFLEKTLA